jgi:hypothetical protein
VKHTIWRIEVESSTARIRLDIAWLLLIRTAKEKTDSGRVLRNLQQGTGAEQRGRVAQALGRFQKLDTAASLTTIATE